MDKIKSGFETNQTPNKGKLSQTQIRNVKLKFEFKAAQIANNDIRKMKRRITDNPLNSS